MWPGSPPLPERARSRSMEPADPGAPALEERASTILGTTDAPASPLGRAYAAGGGVCTCCKHHQQRSPEYSDITHDITPGYILQSSTCLLPKEKNSIGVYLHRQPEDLNRHSLSSLATTDPCDSTTSRYGQVSRAKRQRWPRSLSLHSLGRYAQETHDNSSAHSASKSY